jgi:1-acyl-sn-glycerol-3-phosphate acyltransferase
MIAVLLAKICLPYLASVTGREFLPKPPFILAANHLSPLDPALILSATRLPVRFLAAGHLFKRRWGFIRLYNELAIKRLGQAIPTGPGSITRCQEILGASGIIGIFPEGDIHPELQQDRLHTGLAIIAQQAQVPIVPVHIDGSDRVWTFKKTFTPWRFRTVKITVGKSIPPPSQQLDKKRALAFVTDVMKKISKS